MEGDDAAAPVPDRAEKATGGGAGWKRGLRMGVAAMCMGLLLFAAGFGLFANYVSLLSPPVEPRAADAIIVLTGGQSRLAAAIDLLKSGKGKRLLISGVNPLAGPKALSRATGGDARLFSCCIDIDHVALDTIGNAEESAKWVEKHAYGSVILVTNNYHMPRSLLEMHRLLKQADVQPYPVVNAPLDDGGWLTKPAALRVLLIEYTKYLAALAHSAVMEAAGTGVTVAQAGN